eukprot:4511680-Prymnesium_polylepis.1
MSSGSPTAAPKPERCCSRSARQKIAVGQVHRPGSVRRTGRGRRRRHQSSRASQADLAAPSARQCLDQVGRHRRYASY